MLRIGKNLATKNLVPGQSVYGEYLVNKKGVEYRLWDPRRSKLAAAFKKGLKLDLDNKWLTLYLGVASGTTASHLSDEMPKGIIYGVDPAPRVMRDFILLSRTRKNLVPVFGDANKPESYRATVPNVDFLYQDVAQPNQVDILNRNANMFLKKGGLAFVAVKSRSIDVTANPKKVFKEFKSGLQGLHVVDERRLEPFEKDHLAILLKKK